MRAATLALLPLAACGDARRDAAAEAELARNRAPITVDSGVVVHAQLPDPVISTVAKAGDTLTAIVVRPDLSPPAGPEVPPGTHLHLRIVRLAASGVEFDVDSLTLRSRVYRVSAAIAPVTPTTTAGGALLLDRATRVALTLKSRLVLQPSPD